MLRVGQNTDRQEKRPQNRQAEWQERDALQASPRASWALASLSLDSLHRFDHQCGGPISTHHKCGKPKTSFGFPHNPPFLGGVANEVVSAKALSQCIRPRGFRVWTRSSGWMSAT